MIAERMMMMSVGLRVFLIADNIILFLQQL